jgi:hydrogenase-4 component F
MGLILWAAPLSAVLIALASKGRKWIHAANIGISFLMVLGAIYATRWVILYDTLNYAIFGGVFYIDAVSIIVLDIVVAISFLVSIYSIGYLEEEMKHGKMDENRIKLYYILINAFIFAMVLALTVNNIGILWIAIEATTLASTFLVGFYNNMHAIEAAWKYVIICSVGIALALLGIIFLHLSSVGVVDNAQALQWQVLFEQAKNLNTPILRLAFIFILIGFGTKAGLAPMHTWLPDAHSQAPSPISALLSGVLLNSAMYAIIRTCAIVNSNLGNSQFTGRVMIGFGILSILTAAVFILTQKDYKRLLAYSSIEHMGIIAIAFGLFTPLSIFGGFYHMINHSLTKSMLFLASGNILQKYGTRNISDIKGLLKVLPYSGTAFMIGLFAISGLPPFSIFSSEINIMASIFKEGRFVFGSAFIILLAIIFSGIAVTLFKVFHDTGEPGKHGDRESFNPGIASLMLLLIVISIMGIYMPPGLSELISRAQMLISGGL